MRVFLDANILFSAAASSGAIRRLLDDLRNARHILVADGYVWEEARRNLAVHKPEAVARLHDLAKALELHSEFHGSVRTGTLSAAIPPLVEKDLPVFSAALALGCAALVTGDRAHFGELFGETVGAVTVLSPRGVAELLL